MLAIASRSPEARPLIARAADLASKLGVAWFAVHVRQEPTLHYRAPATEHPVPEADLAAARALGATVILERGEVARALTNFARRMSIRYLVTGRSFRPRWHFLCSLPLIERLQRRLPGTVLIVV